MKIDVTAVTLAAIREAQGRLPPEAQRTPLVPLDVHGVNAQILLKLENLQPIGSFKVRGAGNAMASLTSAQLARGIYTASAGNMAQGVAWNARRMNVPCTVIVPNTAPRRKLDAIRQLGAEVKTVPFDEWWNVMISHRHPACHGTFIHPVSNPDVIAGNGTIGLEILDDVPDVDAIVVPFGGGGLSCGIARAVRETGKATPVFAAEVETAAPLAASLRAGTPCSIAHEPSFVDGIGGPSVLKEMWPLARDLLRGSVVVSLVQIADAIRLLVEHVHVIAEGAGAASVAAALTGQCGVGSIVAVVSGGNIDHAQLATIIHGGTP